MIPEEFDRYSRGVPNHIVVTVINNATRGINWRGCSKKMIRDDLFRYHAETAKKINACLFAEAIAEEVAAFAKRRADKLRQQKERDTRLEEIDRMHTVIGGILLKIPNLQPLFAIERKDLTTFIEMHLPNQYKE